MAADPCATAAHRGRFCSVLAQALPGMEPCFVTAERDGALAGGAPVVIERRAGFHWIHALPFLLPGAPLAALGLRREVDAAVARGIAGLARELRAVGGEWALYRVGADAPDAAAIETVGGETRMAESAVVELEAGFPAVRARMDRKTRQSVRAAALTLEFAEDKAALPEAYALYLAQSRRWRGHRPRPFELLRRLLLPAVGSAPAPAAEPGFDAHAPLARLFTVRDGRGLLSAVLALDHPREVMLWWSGTHPDARGRDAFAWLMISVVEWAARAGRTRVNIGGSAGLTAVAAFKRALGATTLLHPVLWLDASHATAAGRALAAAQAALRGRRAAGARA